MMTGLPDFRDRQRDLGRRLQRLAPRSQARRRLERELRGLVAAELQLELKSAAAPADTVEPHTPLSTHWLQRWESQQDNDQ
jgi:hypothetical protein